MYILYLLGSGWHISVCVCLIKVLMLFTLPISLQFLWLLYLSIFDRCALSISLWYSLLRIGNFVSKILFWRLENQFIFVNIGMECFPTSYFHLFYVDLVLLSWSFEMFLFQRYLWRFLLCLSPSVYLLCQEFLLVLSPKQSIYSRFHCLHSSHPGTCSLLTGLFCGGAASPGHAGL